MREKELFHVCLLVVGLAACGDGVIRDGHAADGAAAIDSAVLMDSTAPQDATPEESPDAGPGFDAAVQSDGAVSQADCSGIAANPSYELCVEEQDRCAGVFTDGSGCVAFCAAAGMTCVARYGGEPGCQQELGVLLDCNASSGHVSDWCECAPQSGPGPVQGYETEFHHTTTGSSDGGKSLVLCPGQVMNFDSCDVGSVNIPRHGDDNGRETYWNMFQEPVGDIVCVKNGTQYKYRADAVQVNGQCP